MFAAKKSQLTRNREPHQCCRDRHDRLNFCNPETEMDLVRRGLIPKLRATGIDYVLVCDRWGVHICTERDCHLYQSPDAKGVCPLTGLAHGIQMVDDLRYREVRGVTQRQPDGLVHQRARAADSSSMVVTQAGMRVVAIKKEPGTEVTPPVAVKLEPGVAVKRELGRDNDAIRTLCLALLEALVDMSKERTDLRMRLRKTLISREITFKDKVSDMVSSLRVYTEETVLGDERRMEKWIEGRLKQHYRQVEATRKEQQEAAERAAQGGASVVVKRRKMMSSANMFGGGAAIVVEEHDDPEAEARRDAEAKRVLWEDHIKIQRQVRRREDGSLIIANKRTEAVNGGDAKDLDAPDPKQEEARRQRDAKVRADAQTKEAVARFKKRARVFIKHLLFSRERDRLVREHEADSREAFSTCVKRYRSRFGREPSSLEMMEIGYNTHSEPPLILIEYDEQLVCKYVDLCTHVWSVVVRHGPYVLANAGDQVCVLVVLGTLYSIRDKGLMVHRTVFLPRNSEMLALPRLNDLSKFMMRQHENFRQSYGKMFNNGCDIIVDAFRKAMESGETVETLRPDMETQAAAVVREGDVLRSSAVEMFAVGRGFLPPSRQRK